jgi:hypothetical protein
LAGAVFIATVGYFAATVGRLNRFVCGQFPILVYGPLVLTVLMLNPLLGRISQRLRFRPVELAVIIIAGLAACSIPSNGLLRYFTRDLVMPLHLDQNRPGWREYGVIKDIPQVMLAGGGQYDKKLVEGFVRGMGKPGSPIAIDQVPWAQWSQTLAFWGAVVFLFAVASICLALIVHRQWSTRERLRYPIAEFANMMLAAPGGEGPAPVYRQRWFWIGVAAMFVFHLVNGLCKWWPESMIRIPLRFDFAAVTRRFEYLRNGWGGMTLGSPMIWPTAVALAFFLGRDVTFSVGISQPLATILFSAMLDMGLTQPEDMIEGGTFNWQRAGSCLALAVMLLYFGRRYYWQVLRQAAGFCRDGRAEAYAVWACRILIVSLVVLTVVLVRVVGLDVPMAVAFVLLTMLAYLAVARITAEFGMFYVQIIWLPVGVLLGLFGAKAMGPSALVTVGMLSAVLVTQPEESLMTFVLIGLKIGQGQRLSQGRAGSMAAVAFMLAIVVAVPFALWVDYNFGGGAGRVGFWDAEGHAAAPFNSLERAKSELRYTGELDRSASMTASQRLMSVRPSSAFLWSTGLGFLVVLGTYALRLRFMWWPIHPVMFLIWETWASAVFFHSFLLAWVIQLVISRVGTHAVHRAVKYLMVGIIVGELLGGMLWMFVGGSYYAATGRTPPYYSIFPY